MSDEGEEVRYSDRDPARTRRGSDDRGRGKRPPIRQREREREIQKSSSFFISFFFLPSKSWLEKVPFWPSSQKRLLSLPKNHPHFLLAFLFYQLIRKNACVQQKTSSELTTFPSPLSLSLSLSFHHHSIDDARNVTQASPPSPSAAGGGSTATTKTTKTKTKKQCSSVYRGVRQRPWGR